ncbi:MAG TPA: hypothetical protein VG406_12155 [Isosphaeraceae bacterium]|jgi:hypothetical protein|nr:hypothetical protein [Isosphaeraceae bacterium]
MPDANLTHSLSNLALILWSGMLIIAGSVWVLSSQVRRLTDLLERRSKEESTTAVVVRVGGAGRGGRGAANRPSRPSRAAARRAS